MPDNMEDILLVKLDGVSGEIIWNKKIHMRNFDRGTSVVEDNDGNYVITGFTSTNDETKSDVFFGKVDPQGNVLAKKAINISKNMTVDILFLRLLMVDSLLAEKPGIITMKIS